MDDTDRDSTIEQTRGRRPGGRLAAAVLVVGVAGLGMTQTSQAAPAVHQSADTVFMDGTATPPGGSATLIRTPNGVSVNISTPVGGQLVDLFAGPLGVDWEVGDATTTWWVVFNDPDECTGDCGEDDVQAAAAQVSNAPGIGVHFATGHVAGSDTWKAAASLREGDSSGVVFGLPLLDAHAAEVHVVVRSHGDPSTIPPGERDDAIGSLVGGCDVDNVCGDPQAAVFLPPA